MVSNHALVDGRDFAFTRCTTSFTEKMSRCKVNSNVPASIVWYGTLLLFAMREIWLTRWRSISVVELVRIKTLLTSIALTMSLSSSETFHLPKTTAGVFGFSPQCCCSCMAQLKTVCNSVMIKRSTLESSQHCWQLSALVARSRILLVLEKMVSSAS